MIKALFTTWAIAALSAEACTCTVNPPCTRVGSDAVIFIGMATTEPIPLANKPWIFHPVRFKVERAFHGLARGTPSVEIDTWANSSCSATFVKGELHLVYARRKGDFVFTSQCMDSKPIPEASADLAFLERYVEGRATTTLQGRLQHDQPAFSDFFWRSLWGAELTAVATDGKTYSTTAGPLHRYEFSPISPGRYQVRVKLSNYRSSLPSYEVNVSEGGCGILDVAMGLDGRVSGQLREPAGSPPMPIKMELIPILEGDQYSRELETTSRRDGTYEFNRVPPGRYRLSINATLQPSANRPYTRVFYPGVSAMSQAKVLAVGAAQSLSGVNLNVSAQLRPRTITAQVIWADGTPAASVHVTCSPPGYQFMESHLTDEKGPRNL